MIQDMISSSDVHNILNLKPNFLCVSKLFSSQLCQVSRQDDKSKHILIPVILPQAPNTVCYINLQKYSESM